jgi:dipeptidyl aminopeptidase/acylaminoacyl peptidase
MKINRFRAEALALKAALALLAMSAHAEEGGLSSGRGPDDSIVEQFVASPTGRRFFADPAGQRIAMIDLDYPSIWELNAGAIDDGRSRIDASTGTRTGIVFGPDADGYRWGKLSFLDLNSGEITHSGLSAGTDVRYGQWSPDGTTFAFVARTEDIQALGVTKFQGRVLKTEIFKDIQVNRAAAFSFEWLDDSRKLLVNVDEGKSRPAKPLRGPLLVPTYDSRDQPPVPELANPIVDPALDVSLLRAGDLKIVSLDRHVTDIAVAEKRDILSAAASYDGNYVIVEEAGKAEFAIWSVHNKSEILRIPKTSSGDKMDWRPGTLVLVWLRSSDVPSVSIREIGSSEWVALPAPPFAGQASPSWLPDGRLMLARGGRGVIHTLASVRDPWKATADAQAIGGECQEECIISDFSAAHASSGFTKFYGEGRSILELGIADSISAFNMMRTRRYVIRRNVETGVRDIIWKSSEATYSRAAFPINANGSRILSYEFGRDHPLELVLYAGQRRKRQLTDFGDTVPALAGQRTKLLEYRRADDLPLATRIYLPPGYEPAVNGPLPTVVWFYPRSFHSVAEYRAEHAAQLLNRRAIFPYDRPIREGGSLRVALTLPAFGYAVADMPDFPLLGEDGGEDGNYLDQLASSAEALVKALVTAGISDPGRIAISGVSRGGADSLNLLARTDLFKTGMALSPGTNYTIMPHYLQYDNRNYWQAPNVFIRNSPALNADKIKESVLLIHGSADQQPFPAESYNMYNALSVNGGRARMVILPGEDHLYLSKEGLRRAIQEIVYWLRHEL